MQVQVNTDANVEGREALVDHVEAEIDATLGRFGDRITRVEVHLSDNNAGKAGGKKCLMEARLAGRQPVVVSDEHPILHEAISGAAKKLQSLLETMLGRLKDHKGDRSIRLDDKQE
jgi:ribosomal subunit interface protein